MELNHTQWCTMILIRLPILRRRWSSSKIGRVQSPLYTNSKTQSIIKLVAKGGHICEYVLVITKGIKSNPVTCHDFDSSPYTQKKMIKFENWQVSVFVFEQAGSSLTDMAITVRNTQRFIPALCTVSRVAQNHWNLQNKRTRHLKIVFPLV